ncbi:MAG TPA: MFS transporter [Streptosporangiaceae bacterium]
MRALLAHRDARIYLGGQVLSIFGDSALVLAMGIWIKIITGSSAAAALLFFTQALGSLLGPLGGMLADRLRRRPLLIITNVATAALILLLLAVHGRQQIWLIYVVGFGYGLSYAVLVPAQTALLQSIVPPGLLGEANGLLQTAEQGMRLVTPLVGAGLLAAFGPAPVIIGDTVTFAIAIASLTALRVTESRPSPSGQRWLTELTAGARHVVSTVVLRQLAIAAAVVVTAFGLSEAVMFAVVSHGLHRPATFLGVLISAQGTGAIAAGVTAAPIMRRLSESMLAALGIAAAALGYLLLIPPYLPAVLPGCALVGASLPWIIVGVFTLLQRRTPPALMGRTEAAFGVMYSVPQTIAIALGAGLITVLGYQLMLVIIVALMGLAAVYLFTREDRGLGGSGIIEPECPVPGST